MLSGALGGTPNGVCQGSHCLGNADNGVITTLLEVVSIFVVFYFSGNVSTDSILSKELTLGLKHALYHVRKVSGNSYFPGSF